MFEKLVSEEQRYEDLMRLLGTTEVQSDSSEYRKHAKALAELDAASEAEPRLLAGPRRRLLRLLPVRAHHSRGDQGGGEEGEAGHRVQRFKGSKVLGSRVLGF